MSVVVSKVFNVLKQTANKILADGIGSVSSGGRTALNLSFDEAADREGVHANVVVQFDRVSSKFTREICPENTKRMVNKNRAIDFDIVSFSQKLKQRSVLSNNQ